MKTKFLVVLITLVLATPQVWAADEKISDQDVAVITLVLKDSFDDGGYTVVSPETEITHFDADDSEEGKRLKKYIQRELRVKGVNINALVNQLSDRNKKPSRLSIKSSPKDGFLIDYDGKYEKYFEKDGGGWEKWYKENPKAHGNTRVSLPAYDEKNGLVLIYKGRQSHWLAGAGYIILYSYKNGELKELRRVNLWVS